MALFFWIFKFLSVKIIPEMIIKNYHFKKRMWYISLDNKNNLWTIFKLFPKKLSAFLIIISFFFLVIWTYSCFQLGELDPNSVTTIQLKYVCELPIENDAVKLSIPNTIAPNYSVPTYDCEEKTATLQVCNICVNLGSGLWYISSYLAQWVHHRGLPVPYSS